MAIDEKYLREFDYLSDCIYLDSASVGMTPQRTLDFCRSFQQEFVDSRGRICFGPYGKMRDAVADQIAQMIGADVPLRREDREIRFITNTTEGDNILVNGLDLKPGDTVISSSYEYPAAVAGWAYRQKEGIRLKLIPEKNGRIEASDVIAAMDETVKVVAFSFVQFRSGYRMDLEKIGEECRRRGILFCIDGIQGVGRLPLNVKKMNIDVLSCGGFKGLMAPFGTGFLYVRKVVQDRIRPSSFDTGNVDADEEKLPQMESFPAFGLREGIGRLQAGSMNTYGILAMGKSIGLLREIGIQEISSHLMRLERYFRAEAKARHLPVHFLGSPDERYWSGNICFTYDAKKTARLDELLSEKKIYVRSGPGYMRIGLHYFNTNSHLDAVLDVLGSVL